MTLDPELHPDDDSEDLTDEEIGSAIPLANPEELAERLRPDVEAGFQVSGYEQRRRKPHFYWRVRLTGPESVEKVLVFRPSWIGDRNG